MAALLGIGFIANALVARSLPRSRSAQRVP
jgi:hypothetical protein